MKFDGTIRVVSSIKPPLYTIFCIFLPFSSSEYISSFMQQNMQQMYASFIDPSDLSNFSKLLFLKKKRITYFLVTRSFSSEKFYLAFAGEKEERKNIYRRDRTFALNETWAAKLRVYREHQRPPGCRKISGWTCRQFKTLCPLVSNPSIIPFTLDCPSP